MNAAPVCRAAALALAIVALTGCDPAGQSPIAALDPAEPLAEPDTSWLVEGNRLLSANRPDEAHAAFVRSLRVEGMTAAALTGAGVAAERRGLLTEARRHFERAKQLDPESVAAHNNLGAVLYAMGDFHAARQAFRTAFALSSGASEEAEQNLGMAELAIGRAEQAEPDLAGTGVVVQRVGSAGYRLTREPAPDSGNG